MARNEGLLSGVRIVEFSMLGPAAITTEEKTAAIAQLEAIGVLVRQGV